MQSNDPSEILHAVNRYLRETDRFARRERRRKWALVAGTIAMGVWAFWMLVSLP